jgi:pimeloyl-ACP methyl ester carboxylesterase
MVTMKLPESPDSMEEYADIVGVEVYNLDSYVLVGDSFGAIVSIAFAVRRPVGLKGLVLSGGFAANPVRNPLLNAWIRLARFLPGPLYRAITLRLHAASLASPYDMEGQVPWPKEATRELFVENTPHLSFARRAGVVLGIDYRSQLHKIDVPTLILSPSFDRLIGEKASEELLEGIPDATEHTLDRTGHMFRFSHPETYAREIERFVEERIEREHPSPARLEPQPIQSSLLQHRWS